MNFGGGSGITQSSMMGLNFADEWFKKLESNGSYFYTNSKNENTSRSRVENLLPADPITGESNSFITESSGFSETKNDGHNMNFDFEYKITPKVTLTVSPKFSKNTVFNEDFSDRSSSNNLGLINKSIASKSDDRTVENFQTDVYLMRAFKKKGRSLGLTFNNINKKNDWDIINKSTTQFFQDPSLADDIRNQRQFEDINDNSYYARLGYLEPLVDSLSLNIRMAYQWKDYRRNRATFDYNDGSQQYQDANASLSYDMISKTRIFNPTVGVNVRKNKYSGGVYLGTQVIDFENNSLFLNTSTALNKKIHVSFCKRMVQLQADKIEVALCVL